MGRRKKTQEKEDKKIQRPKLNLAAETKRGIAVVVFAVLALVVVLSLANIAGSLGQQLFNAINFDFWGNGLCDPGNVGGRGRLTL